MLRNFIKDSAIYTVSIVLSRGISIILVPIYTRVFSPADYGIIDILAVVANLVNLTIALEISQAVARFYAEMKAVEEKKDYVSTALWFTVIVNVIFVVVSQYYCNTVGPWVLGDSYNETLFRVAIFSMAANGIFYLFQNQLRWQLQSFHYAITSVITVLVSVSVTITLIFGVGLGLISVFYGQLVGYTVGAVFSYCFARESYGLIFNRVSLKKMLAFSIPLVPSSIGVFLAVYIDRIAIKELMTIADVGLYGIAYRISSLVGLIIAGVQSSLTPLIYNQYEEAGTPAEIARIFRYFLWGAFLFFLGLSLFARELLLIFTTPQFYGAYIIVPILVPAVLLAGMYVFAPGLAIAKRTKSIAVISISAAFLNTVLNFTLIPYLGIRGAAIATLVGAAMQFSLYVWLGNKYYPIPYDWKRYARALSVIIFLVIGGGFIAVSLWIGFLVKLLIWVTGLILVTWIIIDNAEINKMKKSILRKRDAKCVE
jgi:O-antigen/teichoic acid export membrane protein